MKTQPYLGIVALLLSSAGLAGGELLFENFDSYAPDTSLSDVPGWTKLEGVAAVGGSISTQRSMSAPCAVELPKPPGSPLATKAIAAFTNFSYTYRRTNGFILRAAAYLYRTNNHQVISMELGHGTNTIIQVTFRTNYQMVAGNYTSSTLSVTGRYEDIQFLYDVSNNIASLFYNGSNIMPWRGIGTPVSTQFNLLAFKRLSSLAGTEGLVLFDNARVEAIPASTLGWWRFEQAEPPLHSDSRAYVTEQTGRFLADSHYDSFETGSWDRLWTAESEVHNARAIGEPRHFFRQVREASIAAGNWTLESILRIDPGTTTFCIFDWAHTVVMSSETDSWIRLSWSDSDSNLTCYLREDGRADTESQYYSALGPLPADGEWHHAAIVKSGNLLETYVNYELLGYQDLSVNGYADGGYVFRTNRSYKACVGAVLSGAAAAGSGVHIDEVRFSARALADHELLQIPAAHFLAPPTNAFSLSWTFCMQTRPLYRYYLEMTTNLSAVSPAWTALTDWWASNFVSRMTIPRPTSANAAFRLRR